ncbi:hypothetical protein SAMN05216226_102163 [Halovenus aranensis]|uniref:Uncharacterized protein n=1 Tax=Halovenus aranensis TaxID=890420 RepID=A0A1G8SV43_9EURY|nr:hypothetical protein [Halovenus aranensis]SDJ33142.1 hypothetical protein SAMN05216226_102163 [Halovenus aranensis]
MNVPTPIPKSVVGWVRRLWTGSTALQVWRALLLVVFVAFAGLLTAVGPLGWILGGIIVTTLVSDSIRAVVTDLWNANLYELSVP